jgi:spermidine synthase
MNENVRRPDGGRRIAYLFFFVSGATALIYEVVWMRALALVFGNTTHATATVLAGFMAGLGLGSYFIGRWADRWSRPLLGYGLLEIGISIYVSFTFVLIALVQSIYVSLARTFDLDPGVTALIRLLLAFAVVFVPSFFMGATLPVLVRHFIRGRDAVGGGVSKLYAVNTAGAMIGTCAAGFWLIHGFGMRRTVLIAAFLNLLIGILACLLGRGGGATPEESVKPEVSDPSASPVRVARWVWLGLFVSGATAMIYEVSWTRALAAVLGSTTYAFTIMLCTFLGGIALGSAAYARVLSRRDARVSDWAWLQIVLAVSAVVALPAYDWIGLLTVRLFGLTIGHPILFGLTRFGVCMGLMLIPTFCFGALFPVSVSLYARNFKVLGRDVGALYLGNTFGNLVGSVCAGFLLIPWIGIYNSQLTAVALGVVLGWGAILLHVRQHPRHALAISLVVMLMGPICLTRCTGWDPRMVSLGLQIRPHDRLDMETNAILRSLFESDIKFYREGLNSIVSVIQHADNTVLKVNGKTDASTGADQATQLLTGHIPHLLHKDPKRTLVIGLGSGMSLAAALAHPVESVDCVELEPAVVEAVRFFDPVNRVAYKDPRVRMIENDGRNHLLIETEPYDVVISEPSNPWMAGVASLFTVEYYQLVRARLAQGGILCQWLQAYQISPDDFRSVIASVREVFPHVTLWATLSADIIILASADPLVFDVARAQAVFEQSEHFREDLGRFGMQHPVGLLSYFVLTEQESEAFIEGAGLNTDDRLELEFRAARTLYDRSALSVNLLALKAVKRHAWPPAQFEGAPLENRADMLTHIGEAYLGREERDYVNDARRYFARAQVVDPEYVPALTGLGRCLLRDNKQTYALSLLTVCMERDPESVDARRFAAAAAWKGGDANYAIRIYQDLVDSGSDNGYVFYRLAEALQERGRYKEAAEAYERASGQVHEALAARLGQIKCLRLAGNAVAARDAVEALRLEYRTNFSVYKELAATYRDLNEREPWVTACEDFLSLNPYQYQVWADLALLRKALGDDAGARLAIQKGRAAYRYFDPIYGIRSRRIEKSGATAEAARDP